MKNSQKTSLNQPAPLPQVAVLLRAAGVRPTRQRLLLGQLLFDGNHKHVTAEQMHAVAGRRAQPISLATVYNNLHQFTAAGLLREVVVDATRVYFDTNVGTHHHFYDPETGRLVDVPAEAVQIKRVPLPPAGRVIDQINVIIRLR
ncbi:MAG: iron response transcriptional regulator IrrA [Alphaproteobacteria bacterium]